MEPKDRGRSLIAKYPIGSHILRMWIPRYAEERLLQAARTRPVVVLTGARQTGKTSLLRRLFPSHGFVSLDLPTEAEQSGEGTRGFSASSSPAGHD